MNFLIKKKIETLFKALEIRYLPAQQILPEAVIRQDITSHAETQSIKYHEARVQAV